MVLQKDKDPLKLSLFRAAAIGQGTEVIRLLNNHYNANNINVQGHTPLFLAIDHNQPWTVHILVCRGANARIKNKQGHMAIHQAAWRGDPETLVILLHQDPECVNLTSDTGTTPLHIAAERGHVLCVQILISCGADLTIRDRNGLTATDIAAAKRNGGLCPWLLCLCLYLCVCVSVSVCLCLSVCRKSWSPRCSSYKKQNAAF